MNIDTFRLTSEELTLTSDLSRIIATTITECDSSSISFGKYMELALYQEDLGYYNNLLFKFGKFGDFTTAPNYSKVFSCCLAKQIGELACYLDQVYLLEIGAGDGQFMLDTLSFIGDKIDCYYILEKSIRLVGLQKNRLSSELSQYANKVKWIDRLPPEFEGIIFANEILDAQPCDSYIINEGNIYRREVECTGNEFQYINKAFSPNNYLKSIIDRLPRIVQNSSYLVDINLNSVDLIVSVANCLSKGFVIFIDYGYGQNEYYSAKHSLGTVRGFFRHRKVDNVLILPGLIDITSSVNFSIIALAAIENGLEFIDYTSQGAFLLNCGITELALVTDNMHSVKINNEIKQLTSPNGMGEVFKVIGFNKNIDFIDWMGFSNYSQANRL